MQQLMAILDRRKVLEILNRVNGDEEVGRGKIQKYITPLLSVLWILKRKQLESKHCKQNNFYRIILLS